MEQSRLIKRLLIGLELLLMIFTLGVISCEDNGVSPPDDPAVAYRVWFWEGNRDGMYYNFTPESGAIDSLLIPEILPVNCFSVSADGKRLYMEQSATTAIVSTETGEIVYQLPYRASLGYAVVESPLGDVMVAQCTDGLRLVDATSYDLLFEDSSLVVWDSWYSADGARLYASGTRDGVGGVFRLETDNFSIAETPFADASIYRMRPSPDETTWYLLKGFATHRTFEVYDVASGTVTYSHTLLGGRGEIEITPDGQYLFISEAGVANDGIAPSHFLVYNTVESSLDTISTIGCMDGTNPTYMPIDEMAVTPEGKWLVAGEGIMGDSFLRLNISSMEIDSYYQFPKGGITTYACQIAK